MDSKILEITKKIENGNLNFNFEERSYILKFSEILVRELISALDKMPLFEWSYDFFSFMNKIFMENSELTLLHQNVIYSYCKYLFKYYPNTIEYSLVKEFLNYIKDKDYRENIIEMFKTALNNNLINCNDLINYLLERKEYDKLAQIQFGNNIVFKSNIKKIIKEYPFDTYVFPNCLLLKDMNFLSEYPIIHKLFSENDKINLNQLVYILNHSNLFTDEIFKCIKQEIFKLANTSNINITDLEQFNNLDDLLIYISNKNELTEILLDKCDPFQILILLFSENINIEKNIEDKIIALINNHDERIINSLNNEFEYLHYFPRIYLAALNNGLLNNILLDYNNISSDLSNNILKYIEENNNINIKFVGFNEECDLNELNFLNKLSFEKVFNNNSFPECLYIDMNNQELLNEIISNIKSSFEFAYYVTYNFYISSKDELNIPLFMNKEIRESLFSHQDICTYYILNNYGDKLCNKETYESTKVYLSSYFECDIQNLDYMTNVIGYDIFKYLNDKNIKKLLKMDFEKMKKILALFPKETVNIIDLEGMYVAVKEYSFALKYPNIVESYNLILKSLEENNEDYLKILDMIQKEIDDNFLNNLYKKNMPLIGTIKKEDLLLTITSKIKENKEDSNSYKNLLHVITEYYIDRKRAANKNTLEFYSHYEIPYTIDETNLVKYFLKRMPEIFSIRFQKKIIEYINSNNLTEDLIKKTINCFCTGEYAESNDREVINKLIWPIKNIALGVISELLKEGKTHDYLDILSSLKDNEKIEKKYEYTSADSFTYEIISNLRLDIIEDKLLDTLAYDRLVSLMKKRKFHMIPLPIQELINNSSLNITYDERNIATFISYYYKIFADNSLNSKKTTIPHVLKQSELYSKVSNIYFQILTEEDGKLIFNNPPKNQAFKKLIGNQRLDEAMDWTINNFKREYVTIPAFNKILTLNDKDLRCIVGNFTHPSNITHGERTGACMRIGGVGETLFEFALSNENGFHIRFEDPQTHKYISRVTGFRNGNTVFLNELRESNNENKYTNDELIEFIKMISKMLIEYSKNSKNPIDNVVIHKAFAFSNKKNYEMQDLNIDNIKIGLPSFYSDVGSRAIVLATSNEDNLLVPLNFDKTNIPKYRVAREMIFETQNKLEIVSTINRIHSIKQYLMNSSYIGITPIDFNTGFIYGICNEDWYIYLDDNKEIHSEIIDIDSRAIEEYNEAMKKVLEIIENKKVKHGI